MSGSSWTLTHIPLVCALSYDHVGMVLVMEEVRLAACTLLMRRVTLLAFWFCVLLR